MKCSVAFLLLLLGAAAPGLVTGSRFSSTLRGRRTVEDGRVRGDGYTGPPEAGATERENEVPDSQPNMFPTPSAPNSEITMVAPAGAPAPGKPTPLPTLSSQSDLSVVRPGVPPPTAKPNAPAPENPFVRPRVPPPTAKPNARPRGKPTPLPTLSSQSDLSVVRPGVPPPTAKPNAPVPENPFIRPRVPPPTPKPNARPRGKPTPLPTLPSQSDLSDVRPGVPPPTAKPNAPAPENPFIRPRVPPSTPKPNAPTLPLDTPSVPSPPSSTPKPTMPKLFEDATPESGVFDLCSLPIINVMCGIYICNAPVVDHICAYFGDGNAASGPATPLPDAATVPAEPAGTSAFSPSGSPTTAPSNTPIKTPSKAPTNSPSDSPIPEPAGTSESSPSKAPTNTPIKTPSKAPTISPSDSPTAAPTDLLECPVNGWDPYTIPQLESVASGRIFEYLKESFEIILGTETNHSFVVKDNCVYAALTSNGTETLFDTPKSWLDAAAVSFGGAALDNGAAFSGTAVPRKGDITVARSGVQEWSVLIQAASDTVVGDKPLTWIDLPSEERAEDFRTFLWTILETKPQVLLSNNLNRCGSGPFCWTAGHDACYMDPATDLLHVDYRMSNGTVETVDYTDALKWFDTCAASLNCFRREGGGQFLYAGEPMISKVDEVFAFTGGKTVSGDSLEWECGNERQSYKLYLFARAASRDPQSPFTKRAS